MTVISWRWCESSMGRVSKEFMMFKCVFGLHRLFSIKKRWKFAYIYGRSMQGYKSKFINFFQNTLLADEFECVN